MIEIMNLQDLNKLHGHIAEAALVFMKYRNEDERAVEFAARCEQFAKLLFLEIEVFNEIIKCTHGE